MENDLIYFAGLFDGEGSIFINKSSGKHVAKNGFNYNLRISLRMTDKEAVQDFATYFKLHEPKIISNSKEEWKNIWRTESSANLAKEILMKLLPYLRVKKNQAKLAIEFQENRPKLNRFFGRPDQEESRLEKCYQEMSNLNRRGKH